MDIKRAKNDDHPRKWACQIQDRVLEQHFKHRDYVFFSQPAGGIMNICRSAKHTAALSCFAEKGKLEIAATRPYAPTTRRCPV